MIKKIVIGILLLIIVAALGRGVWAWQVVQTEERAKAALRNAVIKTADLQSYSFTATTTGKITGIITDTTEALGSIKGLPSTATFSFLSKGDVDVHSRENPSTDFTIDGIIETEKTATTTASLLLGAHMIMVDKNNYINFSKLEIAFNSTDPKLSVAQMIVGMANGFISTIKNKWIKMDSMVGESSETPSEPSAIIDKKITDYMRGLSYIKSTTFVEKEKIENHPVYHMNVMFQYEKKLFDILRYAVTESGTTSKDQIEMVNKKLDTYEKSLVGKTFTVSVWVGENDPFIYRVLLPDFTIEDSQDKIKFELMQDMTFYNHNKVFAIVAPKESKSMQEITENIFGAALGGAREKGADAAIKSNLSNLRASAELYYDRNNNSYGSQGRCEISSSGMTKVVSGTCSKNIMGDKSFVGAIKGAASASGKTGYVNVSADGRSWASFVPLKSTPTIWWCVDSKGFSKALLATPLKTAVACS